MANNVVTLKMIENLEQRLNMCSSLESLVPATADDGIESLPCMADPSPTPEEALLQQEEHDEENRVGDEPEVEGKKEEGEE